MNDSSRFIQRAIVEDILSRFKRLDLQMQKECLDLLQQCPHWVLVDTRDISGFAFHDSLEGWVFTWDVSCAATFKDQAEAEAIIKKHYKECPWLQARAVK